MQKQPIAISHFKMQFILIDLFFAVNAVVVVFEENQPILF